MDRETLFKAFRTAIDKEFEAKNFYTDLASKTSDAELKGLLEGFAIEEARHMAKLKEFYQRMKGEGA